MKTTLRTVFTLLLFTQFLFGQKVITTKHWGTNVKKEEYQVDAQGQRNGFYKSYNPDGILLFSYNYKNGNEHGTCIDYAGQRDFREIYCYGKPLNERVMDNGSLKSEKYYGCANNTNYLIFTKKLISTGIFERVEYYMNGNIKEKFNESASYGKEKGMYEKYHENGKLAEKGMIDNGYVGKWFGLYENGDTMYVANYVVGFETFYKKYNSDKSVEYILTMDDKFENIIKTEFYKNGKVKSEKISKTYPFKYECGSSNDPTIPKNWRELAEKKIRCGGDSFSPFDNSYVVTEKVYKESGELEKETNNLLRVVDGRKKVYDKVQLEAEDILWENIQKDKSYENLGKYYSNATINFYSTQVDKIFYELNAQYEKDIEKNTKECEKMAYDSKSDNKSADEYMRISESEKSSKLYEKFLAANTYLVELISTENNNLSPLISEISKMKSQISEGGDIDLSKVNKKEFLLLINKRLELEKKIFDACLIRKKLWTKFISTLEDKELRKTLAKTTSTQELIELIKQ